MTTKDRFPKKPPIRLRLTKAQARKIEEAVSEATLPKAEVYDAYRSWTEEEGLRYPLSKARFTRRLKEQGFHDEPRSWRGIRLIEE